NQNGVYDSGETLGIVSSTSPHGNSVLTINFTVPNDALPGVTGMRVRCRYSATIAATDACTSFSSAGETEDYRVLITEACEAPETSASSVTTPTLNTTSATLSWTN